MRERIEIMRTIHQEEWKIKVHDDKKRGFTGFLKSTQT
jgi:hypothetical protein